MVARMTSPFWPTSIPREDVTVAVFRGAAPNGDFCVRVTHIPTGVLADSDSMDRSQIFALGEALTRLEAKLAAR